MIDTVSAKHPLELYLLTLKVGGVSVMLGVPDQPMELPTFTIIMRKHCLLTPPLSDTLITSDMVHVQPVPAFLLSIKVASVDKMHADRFHALHKCLCAYICDSMYLPLIIKQAELHILQSMSCWNGVFDIECSGLLFLQGKRAELSIAGLAGRLRIGGSLIGGIKEMQDMLNFCSKHDITCEIESIGIEYINTAMERLMKKDVHYRFVIDIQGSLIQ